MLETRTEENSKSLLRGIFEKLQSELEDPEQKVSGRGESEESEEIFGVLKPVADFQVYNETTNNNGQRHVPEHTARFLDVPNFIEAILALLISGLLLAGCLLLIKKVKTWCTGKGKVYDDEEPMKIRKVEIPSTRESPEPGAGQDPDTNNPTTSSGKIEIPGQSTAGGSFSRQVSGISSHSSRSSSRKSHNNKEPRVPPPFVRRPSGPFGDEAMAHVEETYRGAKHYEDKQSSWARKLSTRHHPPTNTKKGRESQ